ncbi:hypothetical protein [Bradyrhizobium sp. LHD-71]|uniref:hypothetical protein n=1 Tax=Bradyrhizobium sp. LHD-71 TaxID=3072141 RepID=UPI00280F690F|nr:hypothetical protein [Bradyrhizobium sp. LHD-71]MDQ8726560.1 hypothetical protein [Bradyrhizobium sp. LHD-71]
MTALVTRFGGRPGGADRPAGPTAWLYALAILSLLSFPAPVSAQIFGDRPAPVPPSAVPMPQGVGNGAINLAPSSGPASAPSLPPSILSPSTSAQSAPTAATPPAAVPPSTNQAVLALSAKFGKDLPNVTGGVVWRVYTDRPDAGGTFRMLREERSPTPNIVLPPGSYVVHASLGLASAVRPVTLRQETTREQFEIPAGGLRIEGRVGTTRIPSGQVTFNIYKGSQFDAIERAPIAQNVPSGDVALIPEGTYYIISNYGDGNSVVRSDIRVQAGKLTDVTVTHRAALIVLKLVSEHGGEALANTSWSVLTPGGDIVKESIGAFPRVVLAEGQYRAIARYEGRVYERSFDVVNGVDGEIEVLSR